MEKNQTTLAIDFGSKYIGFAMVRNEPNTNIPLFAGTLAYEKNYLRKKVEGRAQLRRIRRTKKTKKTRLRHLQEALSSLNLPPDAISSLIRFCRRRGYHPLFEEKEKSRPDPESSKEETLFRFTREDFFIALEKEIQSIIPEGKRHSVFTSCERILNRSGDPSREIRPIRIDNRGVSRCAWDGCEHVTPRRDNNLRDPISQFIYTVFAEKLRGNEALQSQVETMLDHIAELGKRLRNASGPDPKKEKKLLRAKIRKDLRLIKTLDDPESWKVNGKNILNLLENTGGRNRFCSFHSREYVAFLLSGRPIPFKKSLTEKDLTSRMEEILYQKLWRYLEARCLPLAPQGIDRIVVERAAFDLLAGTFKQRKGLSDEALEQMYQEGPRFNFNSVKEMLIAEFGGLCAYCGEQKGDLIEREHILPRSRFFFDSYLNLVPSCPACNRNLKGQASMGEVKLTINQKAYEAYAKYVGRKTPPHFLHTIKKGLLKRMTDQERILDAEAYLAMIANNFSKITNTQRSPRPLARYLFGKLHKHYRREPQEIVFHNGKHSSLWRRAAYPEFDKVLEKEEGGRVNHALDALLMACKLPSPTLLEAKFLKPMEVDTWISKVKELAPPPGPGGIPDLPLPAGLVEGFEEVAPGNYILSDVGFMNWNRKDSKIQRQDAYGWSNRENVPVKRIGASEFAQDLNKAGKNLSKISKMINDVVHPNLRTFLKDNIDSENPGESASKALKNWLRKSLTNSPGSTFFSNHPADQERLELIRQFIDGKSEIIPSTIGVRNFYRDHAAQLDLKRFDPNAGKIIHHYYADPANHALIVAYKGNNGMIKRDRPFEFKWRQSSEVIHDYNSLGPVPEGPLKGTALGQPGPDPHGWEKALHEYLVSLGFKEYAIVFQGCVVSYENGREKYIRNFAANYGFKKEILKRIVGVRPSPLSSRLIHNTVI